MKREEFSEFDHIHVPDHTKNDLYAKLDTFEQNRRKHMKTKMLRVSIAATCAIVAVLVMPGLFSNKTVDFTDYLKVSASEVKEPLTDLTNKKKALEEKLRNGKITVDEFLKAYDALTKEKEAIVKKKEEVDKKYNINEKSEEVRNNAQVSSFLEEIRKLEEEDAALDAKEDALEKEYREGKITKQQFIQKERALEAQEDALDSKEDAIEKKSGYDDDRYDTDDKDDDRYDTDDDDDNDDDDKDDDHDDDDDYTSASKNK